MHEIDLYTGISGNYIFTWKQKLEKHIFQKNME